MSLDYQMSPYGNKKKGDTKKRTSYGRMHNWYEYSAKEPLQKPYASADPRVFRKLDPQIDVPLHHTEHYSYNGYQPSRRWTPNKSPLRSTRLGSVEPMSPAQRLDEPFSRREERSTTEPPHIESGPVSCGYYKSGGYDDYHKSFLRLQKLALSPTYPKFGPPRMRNGRVGGSWRHIKEVLHAKGQRSLHLDGIPRNYDNSRIANAEAPGINLLQPVHGSDVSRIANAEAPGINLLLQPVHGSDVKRKIISTSGHEWTAHDLEAFKATEAGNWLLMR